MDINSTSQFIGIKHVAPVMIKQNSGSIINLSSIAAMVGAQSNIAYQASKGANRIIARAAAVELAKYGIRVNSIHPGGVNTTLLTDAYVGGSLDDVVKQTVPLGYLAEPEELAKVILFLACDDSSYITGAEIVADGGVTAL